MERQSCVRYVAWRGRQSISSIPSAVRTTNARTNAIWPSTVSMSRRAFPIPYSPCVSNGTRLRRASSRETLPRDRGAFGVRPRSAPDAFACVGSGVCVLDEGFGRAAVHGIRGNAPGARRHLDRTTARELHVGPIEDLHQTDDHLLGFLPRRVRHHDRELIASVSGRYILGPHPFRDRLSKHPKDLVPGEMAVRVVDLLELVDVEERHRQRRLVALGARDLLLETVVEVAIVVDAGERVGVRGALQTLVQLGDLDLRRDLGADRLHEGRSRLLKAATAGWLRTSTPTACPR